MRPLPLLAAALAALAVASGAGAATPSFGVYNLRLDLARASHNEFGDIKLWQRRDALARRAPRATLVRCGAGCPFGSGWFAFARGPELRRGDLASASAQGARGPGWSLTLALTASGRTHWRSFSAVLAQRLKQRGVPDVLVVVARGSVVATAFANAVRHPDAKLVLPGLTRADALRAAKLLR